MLDYLSHAALRISPLLDVLICGFGLRYLELSIVGVIWNYL